MSLKKSYSLGFHLISVPEVGFYFFHIKGAKDTFTKGKFTFLFKVLDTEIPSSWRGYGRKISGYIYNTNKFETFGLCERYIFHGFRN